MRVTGVFLSRAAESGDVRNGARWRRAAPFESEPLLFPGMWEQYSERAVVCGNRAILALSRASELRHSVIRPSPHRVVCMRARSS